MNHYSKAEKKMHKHAAIEMCAMISADESEMTVNNEVILFVKKSEDYSEKPNDILINELMAYARDILPPDEVPEQIIFVNTDSLTSDGKIDKKALQKMFYDN